MDHHSTLQNQQLQQKEKVMVKFFATAHHNTLQDCSSRRRITIVFFICGQTNPLICPFFSKIFFMPFVLTLHSWLRPRTLRIELRMALQTQRQNIAGRNKLGKLYIWLDCELKPAKKSMEGTFEKKKLVLYFFVGLSIFRVSNYKKERYDMEINNEK